LKSVLHNFTAKKINLALLSSDCTLLIADALSPSLVDAEKTSEEETEDEIPQGREDESERKFPETSHFSLLVHRALQNGFKIMHGIDCMLFINI